MTEMMRIFYSATRDSNGMGEEMRGMVWGLLGRFVSGVENSRL